MTELLKAWFIFSCSLGCWTCLSLLLGRRGDRNVKYTILAFVSLLLLPPLNAYSILLLGYPLNWLIVLCHKITWGYGPLMVILIQHVLLQKNRPLMYVLHALPFTLSMLHDLLALQWINKSLMDILLFIQVFSYLGYAAYVLQQHRSRISSLTSQHKNSTYYWLMYLIVGLAIIMLYDVAILIATMLKHEPSFIILATVASMVAIYVNAIALFSLYQPDVFFHEIQLQEADVPAVKSPLRNIELSPEAAQQLDAQLDQLVRIHKPHMDDSISLGKLASLLGVTTHQLSELLNIHKSISFYDFLNDLRYQESLKLLNNDRHELTIADIAYQAGFNNRNSFYKVFKEKTGLTPTEYKKAKIS